MKLKQHRADIKALREMNCSGIADRVYRLILAAEEGLDQLSQPQLAGGGFTKRIQAVLKDAKGGMKDGTDGD
ncbi:MAG: hypothetical protein ABIJ57_04365 [Pseudomonadota bacterium]